MQQPTTRRNFLKTALAVSGLALAPPALSSMAAVRSGRTQPIREPGRVLVVVQLVGGNDALNTVVPYADDTYHRLRPTLRIRPPDVIPLDDLLGLNRSVRHLAHLYDEGRVAIVLGVGYPKPNRSHFRATEIWHTACQSDARCQTGWLGRCLDTHVAEDGGPSPGLALTAPLPPILRGAKCFGKALPSGKNAGFQQLLSLVAALIRTDHAPRVYFVEIRGFDTHANQLEAHNALLHRFALGIARFDRTLRADAISGRVLTVVFSEFGRRLAENGSRGTDHGTAGAMFLIGQCVKPGIYGTMPSLADLDAGDLNHTVDFRSVYATVLRDWLETDPLRVLQRPYPPLSLIA